MNDTCPSCHLKFEREPGYFTGAMYISYALAVPPLTALTAIFTYWLLPDWPLHEVILLAAVLFTPLIPMLFRYSRIIWIHLDRYFVPHR